jgi:hypothetical protein
VRGAAQLPDPEGDQHGAQQRVRRQEDERDGKQGPRDGLRAQRPHPLGQVACHGAGQGIPVRVPAAWPGRGEHGCGGQQVAEGIGADQPPDPADRQQDAAERAAD